MKFEVADPAGRIMMWTTSPAAVPDETTQRQMRRAGYKVRQTEGDNG